MDDSVVELNSRIASVFIEARKVCDQVGMVFRSLDDLMGQLTPPWNSPFGNTCLGSISRTVDVPWGWLPGCVWRAYTRGEMKGDWSLAAWICVEFQDWDNDAVDPCVMAGVMRLTERGAYKKGIESNWLWCAQVDSEEIDGAAPLRRKVPEERFTEEIISYAFPLAMLGGTEDLQSLVVNPTVLIAQGEIGAASQVLTQAGVPHDWLDYDE